MQLQRLLDVNTDHTIILWMIQFLDDRRQRVSLDGLVSEEFVLNTGVPQGCVLSPVLFPIYTDEFPVNNAILTVKYADGMVLIGRLVDEIVLSAYFYQIEEMSDWFRKRFLELSVGKTSGLACDTRREGGTPRAFVLMNRGLEL